jgi:hypothetical protein
VQPRSVVLLVLALEGPRSLGSFPLVEQFPPSTESQSIVA